MFVNELSGEVALCRPVADPGLSPLRGGMLCDEMVRPGRCGLGASRVLEVSCIAEQLHFFNSSLWTAGSCSAAWGAGGSGSCVV